MTSKISKIEGVILLFGVLFLCLTVTSSTAQTVKFSFDVQPELGIEVLQDINFGTVVSNSGRQQIDLGNSQMGVFKIKALAAQSARLTLQTPEYLSASNSENNKTIPISLEAAYSANPSGYADSIPFKEGTLDISLGDGNMASLSPSWETGFVFVYGTIKVGEVQKGLYSGTLVLNITYQ